MTATPKELTIYLDTMGCGEMSLEEFQARLDSLRDDLPEEHRSLVRVDIGDDGDWDRPRPQLTVFYSRMETVEEAEKREAGERKQQAQCAADEIAVAKRILAHHGVIL